MMEFSDICMHTYLDWFRKHTQFVKVDQWLEAVLIALVHEKQILEYYGGSA